MLEMIKLQTIKGNKCGEDTESSSEPLEEET